LIRPQFSHVDVELVDRHAVKRLRDEQPLEALDDTSWGQLREIIATRRTTIILDHPHAFVTSLPLPTAGVNFAERMIELQIERLSPVSSDKIYWNWTLDREGGQHIARIGMVLREEITRIDEILRSHSIQMPAIAVSCAPTPLPLINGFDGTDTQERRNDFRYYYLSLLLVVSTPFLIFAGLTLAKFQMTSDIESLEEIVGPKIRAQARSRALAQAELVLQPITSRPAATDIIETLASALPDNAILNSLVMDESGQIQLKISGLSAQKIQSALAPQFRNITVHDEIVTTSETPSAYVNVNNILNQRLIIVEIIP
jgi:hypothetical protein